MNNDQDQQGWDQPHLNHLEREYHIFNDSHSIGEHTPTYYGPPPDDDPSIGDNTVEQHRQHDLRYAEWVNEQRNIAI